MAQIGERRGVFRARVRRLGAPDLSNTFTSKDDAAVWAVAAEAAIRSGRLAEFQHKDTTLDSLLEKYGEKKTVLKRGSRQEADRIKLLRASKLAKFRRSSGPRVPGSAYLIM